MAVCWGSISHAKRRCCDPIVGRHHSPRDDVSRYTTLYNDAVMTCMSLLGKRFIFIVCPFRLTIIDGASRMPTRRCCWCEELCQRGRHGRAVSAANIQQFAELGLVVTPDCHPIVCERCCRKLRVSCCSFVSSSSCCRLMWSWGVCLR